MHWAELGVFAGGFSLGVLVTFAVLRIAVALVPRARRRTGDDD